MLLSVHVRDLQITTWPLSPEIYFNSRSGRYYKVCSRGTDYQEPLYENEGLVVHRDENLWFIQEQVVQPWRQRELEEHPPRYPGQPNLHPLYGECFVNPVNQMIPGKFYVAESSPTLEQVMRILHLERHFPVDILQLVVTYLCHPMITFDVSLLFKK
jgi:hypothetical protein